MTELLRFKSHIEGKNADVAIHSDHIEWALEGRFGTKSKLALGAATGGLSLLKTGIGGGTKGTEIIPIKSISSVTTRKDGIRFTVVSVITSGNTIDFRVGHAEAGQIKTLMMDLVLGRHASQTATPPAPIAQPPQGPHTQATPAAPAAGGSTLEQLKMLGELRDSGVLTAEEFDAQKAAILGTPAAPPPVTPAQATPHVPDHSHLPPPPGAASN